MGTPLSVARDQFQQWPALGEAISDVTRSGRYDGDEAPVDTDAPAVRRPVGRTVITPDVDVAHDVFATLIAEVSAQRSDMLLMGWERDFSISRIYHSPLQRILSHAQADVAVLKDRGLTRVESVLVPWGGGLHALLGLEIALRVAGATGARVRLLRVVRPGIDTGQERRALEGATQRLVDATHDVAHIVREDRSVVQGLQGHLAEDPTDLVVIGASREWRIRNVLFGSIPDVVADSAPCSVVMVRRFLPDHWSLTTASRLKSWREALGFTTSPEEEPTLDD
jgi:nucleotide-binding universal stress UspA family protein